MTRTTSPGTWGRGSTRQSRATRDRTLARWPVCYLRLPGCTTTATEDDHVIPLAEGGSDHDSNHRGACANCHGIKSRQEAARGRARRHRSRATRKHPNLA